ncbi:serine/threonine protein phosphatase (Nem1-Spo7 complex) catalytic subunit Nem1 [Schizosaccharomyces osmophilus]|uniref:Serine/threonine protein phosphatase (Nem1-Spo7 complex) catalytic subunit Nem1 n=1 Tax=Schizosaccharomyces osmophilus TaxID=2545709 RepID=A0AAF0AU15_9SCHI|nr:serine/threonine protein phosphatase (Nem1-Spo7 complex) catalytic subunit Nem1 [Schizosaccharomyces osmophilus]WBW70938.1 serine/threonine protein phosphatase (Nem1-Spo7 complex) catalytic subunit Nem1 [Schizosaccharomyces osmophilus]
MNSIAKISDEINKAILATPVENLSKNEKSHAFQAQGQEDEYHAQLEEETPIENIVKYPQYTKTKLRKESNDEEASAQVRHANIMRVIAYWLRICLKRTCTLFFHALKTLLIQFINENKKVTFLSFLWGLCRIIFFPAFYTIRRRQRTLSSRPKRPKMYSSYSAPSFLQGRHPHFRSESNVLSHSTPLIPHLLPDSIAEEDIVTVSDPASPLPEELPSKIIGHNTQGPANGQSSLSCFSSSSSSSSSLRRPNVSASFTIVNDPYKSPSASHMRIRNITLCADRIPRPLLSNKLPKKTLVLDLDETLIHSVSRGSRTTSGQPVEVHVPGEHPILYYIHKRPHLDYFLANVSEWFHLVLFTASVQPYADPIIDFLERDKKLFVERYYRQHCTLVDSSFVKDISICKIHLSRIMIIDNSPASYNIHKENAIPVEGWISDPSDVDLLNLLSFLYALQYVQDVRALLRLRLAK